MVFEWERRIDKLKLLQLTDINSSSQPVFIVGWMQNNNNCRRTKVNNFESMLQPNNYYICYIIQNRGE